MADGMSRLPPDANHRATRGRHRGATLKRLVLLGVFLAHVVGWLLVEQLARYRPAAVDGRAETSITIEFVAATSSAVDAPPADSRSARQATGAPSTSTSTRRTPTVDEGVAVQFLPREPQREPGLDARRLFAPDGTVRLPQDTADVAGDPFAPPAPAPREPVLTHESTRFDRAWTPDGENLGQEIVRKFPPALLLLQGVHLPECPPDSNHANCEATAREQRARIPPTPQSARQPW